MPLPEVLEGKPYEPWPPAPAGKHFVVRCEDGSSAEMEVVGSHHDAAGPGRRHRGAPRQFIKARALGLGHLPAAEDQIHPGAELPEHDADDPSDVLDARTFPWSVRRVREGRRPSSTGS